MWATLAIMAALDYRRRTGQGQYIDHAQIEAGLNYMTPLILDYQANSRELALKGNKCEYAAPHGIYRCQGEDRWAAIAVMTEEQWKKFVKAIGTPKWTESKKFTTMESRLKNSDELDKLVETWTINYPPEVVEEMLQSAGIGAGVVANSKDIDEDPQLNYYNFYREMDHPYVGRLRYYHPDPIKLSAAEADIQRPVLLGEHTDKVCREILGMTQGEIDGLREKGVFE
jgi:benzylsuccinate CoA-transferase BbsF subunit